jgi:mono/diheme cytochrome c family protein
MREIIARLVSVLTVCVVGALSLLFAFVHNPRERTPAANGPAPSAPAAAPAAGTIAIQAPERLPAPTPVVPAAEIERGREVYAQHNCATCHSIAGEGNPRNPLDGIGVAWSPRELEAWITGAGAAAEILPSGIVKRKQRYQSLTREDMNALIAYLSSLKPSSAK